MVTALFAIIMMGLIAVVLSLENDKLKKNSLNVKKTEEDRIYKLSVVKEIQEKIAYTTDPEKVVDVIMVSLRNFFEFSVASSLVLKDSELVFKTYAKETIGTQYLKKVEESMLASLRKLAGRLPARINRKSYGLPIDNAVKSIYLSSFHLPLVANNKVLAIIHLSSTKTNAHSDMRDLRELIDTASASLTHLGQAMNRETEKFSSLVLSLIDGIFMLDDKNNLLIINDSAKKLLGIANNANLSEIAKIFPQPFNLEEKINEVRLNKISYFEKEIQVSGLTLSLFVNPVGNDKTAVILRNVTDSKKKEILKEDLINGIIHELRSPVTTIKDSAELMLTTQKMEENKKLKFLEIIHQQAKKVLGQIGSILDTAKLDAGKLVLQKTKGDITKLIKDEIQTFIPQAQRKNIALSFNIVAHSLPEILYDEIRISQVIDNLLSNSLKFTPENGKIQVEIDYRTIPPVLDGTSPMGEFLSLDKYIVVSVLDNGEGIAPEQQKFLFSKYTQSKDTSEKLATLGTGLGLYLVKGIVESHDGRIWVKSALGRGTTISFALPAADTVKASYDAPKPSTTPLAKLSQTVN